MEWVIVALGTIFVLGNYLLEQRIRMLEKRLAHIDSIVRLVAEKLGVSDPLESELRQMVANGQKIEAIKRVREARGLTLREAKDFVDLL
jgi:ribosomal protein L7/L12